MKESKKNIANSSFLNEKERNSISKHHKDFLGTTIPNNYFATSKQSILDKIKEQPTTVKKLKKQKVFWLLPKFKYAVAASLVFIVSITIWLQNSTNNNTQNNIELLSFNEDVLLNSLFIEDSELETFTNTTLINEVVIKAELSEQKIDDVFINSLFVEDSLIDNYTDDKFLETIIL